MKELELDAELFFLEKSDAVKTHKDIAEWHERLRTEFAFEIHHEGPELDLRIKKGIAGQHMLAALALTRRMKNGKGYASYDMLSGLKSEIEKNYDAAKKLAPQSSDFQYDIDAAYLRANHASIDHIRSILHSDKAVYSSTDAIFIQVKCAYTHLAATGTKKIKDSTMSDSIQKAADHACFTSRLGLAASTTLCRQIEEHVNRLQEALDIVARPSVQGRPWARPAAKPL